MSDLFWTVTIVMFILSLYAVEWIEMWYAKRGWHRISTCVECGDMTNHATVYGTDLCDACQAVMWAEYNDGLPTIEDTWETANSQYKGTKDYIRYNAVVEHELRRRTMWYRIVLDGMPVSGWSTDSFDCWREALNE